MQRKQQMFKDLAHTVEKVAETLGCNTQCMDKCAAQPRHEAEHCFTTCQCLNGVVKITPVRVNTYSILKDTYGGDLTNLSDEEIENVNETLALF